MHIYETFMTNRNDGRLRKQQEVSAGTGERLEKVRLGFSSGKQNLGE